ncbi:hypothetical protein RB601_003206 [Gaeumannomyces tritici]
MAVGIVKKVSSVLPTGCRSEAPVGFAELVMELKHALGPSSGLTSDDVDVNHLTWIMDGYDAREQGWLPFAMRDASRGYTRNLVDEGNGKSNLLVLVWSPGKGSPIHDHGNAHCLMKILRGELTETRYAHPREGIEEPMTIISERTHKENAVAYMADELGLHRVWNKGSDFAVSLHRECRCPYPWPPWVHGCQADRNSVHAPKRGQEWLLRLQCQHGEEEPCKKMWQLL